jgi:hypothetical protein
VARVRAEDPSAYLKLIGHTLPREVLMQAVSITASLDLSQLAEAEGYFRAYRFAQDRIGVSGPSLELSAEAETSWRIDHDD